MPLGAARPECSKLGRGTLSPAHQFRAMTKAAIVAATILRHQECRLYTVRRIQPSYMAAVTHIDTSSYWVSRAHWTADSANKRALAACKAAMGDGCVLNETVYGYGTFGVMIDAMGLRWIKSGADVPRGTPESIRYQALAMLCVKNSFGCEFDETIWQGAIPEDAVPPTNFVTDNFPLYGVKRHHWALLAKPESTPSTAWQNKAWLMSGSQNSAEARKAVLDRCRADFRRILRHRCLCRERRAGSFRRCERKSRLDERGDEKGG